jgi:hypothetical protein
MTPFSNNFDQIKAAEDRVVEAQTNTKMLFYSVQ